MTPEDLQSALSRAVRDPGAVVGRRLDPSWGEGNPGYADPGEDLWTWIVRALVHTVEPIRAEAAGYAELGRNLADARLALAKRTGERDDALATIRALVDPEPSATEASQ